MDLSKEGADVSNVDVAVNALFPVVSNASDVVLDPNASRMLSPSKSIVATSIKGDVLEVCTSERLTPAFVKEIETRAGMLVSLSVGSVTLVEELYTKVTSTKSQEFTLAPILRYAVEVGATDIHIATGSIPVARIHGVLKPMSNCPPISKEDLQAAAKWLTNIDMPVDGPVDMDTSLTYMAQRWRISIYKQRQSLAMALRLIPANPPTPEQIGLPKAIVDTASASSGLVLFCGPTGSGKSTSMAALIDRINKTRSCHIVTIEDPVEYVHTSKMSTVHQREVGADTESFASALRASLRQDPDVILVGELRDLETMRTALSAAETGHLVLATIHASSTASAITRLVSSFPSSEQTNVLQQLAGSLKAVVYQVLLSGINKNRVLACEVLVATTGVKTIIRDNRLHELPSALDSSGGDVGMVSINKSLAAMVNHGSVTSVQAEVHVSDLSLYRQYLAESKTYDALTLDPLRDAPSFGS